MRIAALIFGLLAGLAGVTVAAFGILDAGLVAALDMGPLSPFLARFAIATVPALSLLGAGLALAHPRMGGLVLVLSALGWLGMALASRHGALLFAALPLIFALAAALTSFFARRDFASDRYRDRSEPGFEDLSVSEPRAPAVGRYWGDDDPAPEPEPVPEPEPEPQPRRPRSLLSRREPDFAPTPRQREFEEPALPEYEDDVPDEPPPASRDDPDSDYARPARYKVPSRHEYAADPEYPPAPPEFAPLPAYSYPDDDERDERPRSRAGMRRMIGLINLALFLIIFVAIALFVYLDYRRGAHSLLFGAHRDQVASTAVPVTPKPTRKPAPPAATPASRPAPIAPTPMRYASPQAYCEAVKTVDTFDPRYDGPKLPAPVIDALHVPNSIAPAQVHMRCLNGALLACVANDTHKCDITPTVDQMIAFCRTNPDRTGQTAPNGTWACNGTTPVIPAGQSWPVDARGFYPQAWTVVTAATPR